jgi:hypothetical protein
VKHKIFEDVFGPQGSKHKLLKERSEAMIKPEEGITSLRKQKNPKLTLPLHKMLHNM